MAGASLLTVGQLFVVLVVAGALALRAGLSVIPLYVVGGVVAGPAVLGAAGLPHVAPSESITLLAELGVVFLLFFLGLEFSLDRLVAARRRMTAAGVVDLVVNFPLGVALGLLFGWPPVAAVLLGGVVYISSSAIVTKTLVDLGWIANPESEAVLGTLVFEDLVVAVYLAVVSALVVGGDAATVGRSLAVALGFLVLLVAAVALGDRALDRFLDVGPDEAFVLRVFGIVVPIAGAALALGVSEAVAAFFVGVGVSGTEHVERVERRLVAVRDVFAAVFFFWIGLNTDPWAVLGAAVPLAVVVVVTAPAKVLSGYIGGRIYELSERRSVRSGLALVARGEFSLVIAALAVTGTGEVLTTTLPAVAVGYVLVMSVLGTGLMQFSAPFERLLARERA